MQDETTIIPGESREEQEFQPLPEEIKKKSFFTFNTLLELVLLAGLIILYVLWFSAKPASEKAIPVVQKSGGSNTVVFVNLDTLNARYAFVKALSTDLEATGKKLQTEILNEQGTLEKEAADFQKQVQSNAIPEDKAKKMYEVLMQRQQALMEKKERYTQQVADKEMKMHQTLLDTVDHFLKRYNRDYGYDYILGYSRAGEILLANDTLDITDQVLKALNDQYKEKEK